MTGRAIAAVCVASAWVISHCAAALALPPFTMAPKSLRAARGAAQPQVFALSVGCHRGYDRLVIRTRPATPGADVRYVARVEGDPSGLPVALLGHARIAVVLR